MSDRIEADYLIETAYPLEQAAEAMAGEQSSGTFVPGSRRDARAQGAFRRTRRSRSPTSARSTRRPCPAPRALDDPHRRAAVTLSWPLHNTGPSLPNLMATVAGNLFELKQFSGLKLTALRLPRAFGDAYMGPAFGVEGTRRLSGVEGRPLIGTIIKPSVGFSADETADLVKVLCEAGIDFIKDDELQADGPSCPFDDRVEAVMRVVNDHSDRTGKKVMFAFNLTGEIDEMRRRHDLVMERGGTCVMASLNAVGLVGMAALRRHTALPIHAHRNGWGMYDRHPMLGISYVAWQVFWRLIGCDHMHVNGIANKFCEPDESVIASAKACLTPLYEDKPCIAMPVFSSGQGAKQPPATYEALGSPDLIYAAGGGIMAHPDGVAAGVSSLREAWDAAMEGTPLEEYAKTHPALAAALGDAR